MNVGQATDLRLLRKVGWIALVPLPAMIIMIVLRRRIFWPDSNLEGSRYLDYAGYHIGIAQTLIYTAVVFAIGAFFCLMALVYYRSTGALTPALLLMGAAAVTNAALALVSNLFYLLIPVTGNGFPEFGSDRMTQLLATYSWNASNFMYGLAAPALGVAFLAIAAANRRCPMLPPAYTWAAAGTGALNIVSIGAIFSTTGPWSPGTVTHVALTLGPACLWLVAAGTSLIRRKPPGTQPRFSRKASPSPSAKGLAASDADR
ncbi:hypothetical protein [Streptomyces sp. NRRL F-2664]|uniref:hypothetical protein n=1 Tax=Streptomyces sp. NRRL F-2664 TaxID=1463842 RepID=UPI0004CBBD32|nr:hypothetical protein [Streptomyces sp. NRRL F-2664]